VLEGGHGFFAGDVAGHVELDAAIGARARGVLQGGEGRLAHDALEHHAAGHGHTDGSASSFVLEAVVLRVQVGGVVGRAEIVGEGDALLADGGQLGAALGDDAVLVGCRLGGGVFAWSWLEFLKVERSVSKSRPRRAARPPGSDALFQRGCDEVVDVAIEHGLGIAGFEVGAQSLMRDWSST
jgi:hypothetical protein